MTDGDAAGWEPAALVAGRILLATIFMHDGLVKILSYAGAVRYAEAFGLPGVSIAPAIAVELGCGVLVIIGLFTRAAAIVLGLFCLATAAIFHTKFGETNQLLHFEKNVAMAGGLLVLAVYGAGRGRLTGCG